MYYVEEGPSYKSGLFVIEKQEGNVTHLKTVPVELTTQQLHACVDRLTYWKFPEEIKSMFDLDSKLFWQHEVNEKAGLGTHEIFSASHKTEHRLNEAEVVLDFHASEDKAQATRICISGIMQDSKKTSRVVSLAYSAYSGKLDGIGIALPKSELKYQQTFERFLLTPHKWYQAYEHGGGIITTAMMKTAYTQEGEFALVRAYDRIFGGNYLQVEGNPLSAYEPRESGLSVKNGEEKTIFNHNLKNYSLSFPSNLTY